MIVRRGKDVERIDVGKTFGSPQGVQIIQWYFDRNISLRPHSSTGRYHQATEIEGIAYSSGNGVGRVAIL